MVILIDSEKKQSLTKFIKKNLIISGLFYITAFFVILISKQATTWNNSGIINNSGTIYSVGFFSLIASVFLLSSLIAKIKSLE
jgi:surface polysaccharide O-acyltransferase-like enzyme